MPGPSTSHASALHKNDQILALRGRGKCTKLLVQLVMRYVDDPLHGLTIASRDGFLATLEHPIPG